jgi:hypothetical protein
MPQFGRTTNLVVGAIISTALLSAFWFLLPRPWFIAAAALLAYEGWTLVNKAEHDTISESVWRLSIRPLVPFLFGAFTGWATEAGYFDVPWVAGAWYFLMAHFFFSRVCSTTKEEEESEKI